MKPELECESNWPMKANLWTYVPHPSFPWNARKQSRPAGSFGKHQILWLFCGFSRNRCSVSNMRNMSAADPAAVIEKVMKVKYELLLLLQRVIQNIKQWNAMQCNAISTMMPKQCNDAVIEKVMKVKYQLLLQRVIPNIMQTSSLKKIIEDDIELAHHS